MAGLTDLLGKIESIVTENQKSVQKLQKEKDCLAAKLLSLQEKNKQLESAGTWTEEEKELRKTVSSFTKELRKLTRGDDDCLCRCAENFVKIEKLCDGFVGQVGDFLSTLKNVKSNAQPSISEKDKDRRKGMSEEDTEQMKNAKNDTEEIEAGKRPGKEKRIGSFLEPLVKKRGKILVEETEEIPIGKAKKWQERESVPETPELQRGRDMGKPIIPAFEKEDSPFEIGSTPFKSPSKPEVVVGSKANSLYLPRDNSLSSRYRSSGSKYTLKSDLVTSNPTPERESVKRAYSVESECSKRVKSESEDGSPSLLNFKKVLRSVRPSERDLPYVERSENKSLLGRELFPPKDQLELSENPKETLDILQNLRESAADNENRAEENFKDFQKSEVATLVTKKEPEEVCSPVEILKGFRKDGEAMYLKGSVSESPVLKDITNIQEGESPVPDIRFLGKLSHPKGLGQKAKKGRKNTEAQGVFSFSPPRKDAKPVHYRQMKLTADGQIKKLSQLRSAQELKPAKSLARKKVTKEKPLKAEDSSDDDFDIIPKKEPLGFCYKEDTVRNKAARAQMPAFACQQCKEFFENDLRLSEEEKQERINKVCKHKSYNPPPNTPPNFWNVEMSLHPKTLTPEIADEDLFD